MKIMYLHGLEGSATKGAKAVYCKNQFGAVAPQMPATLKRLLKDKKECISECLQIAIDAVNKHQPELIIGSSFGGGITMGLLQGGHYKGDAILLAPAGVKYGLSPLLPTESKIVIIHDQTDEIVPFEDSLKIVRENTMNGGASVELVQTTGGHKLHNITKNGLLMEVVSQF
tara:strand:- start:428 stop:940 length:513 start_codon:yes stop_codon:yes gene_type:complete